MIKELIHNLTKPPIPYSQQLVDHGASFTISHPWRTFTGIQDGDTFITFSDQAPVPGQTFLSTNAVCSSIVTSTCPGPEDGLTSFTAELMPFSISIHRAVAVGVTLEGKDRFRLSPTNWRGVPAQKPYELTFRLPKPYVPERGELIFHDGNYFQVLSTTLQGPYCICTTQEFNV